MVYIVTANAEVLIAEVSVLKYKQLAAYNHDGDGHLSIQSEMKEIGRCK